MASTRSRSGEAGGRLSLSRETRATAFWLGVVLPVVYLPLLFVSVEAFLAMLPVHVVALVVGYGYAP